MGGGEQSTNTIQKSDPWAGQQQYLLDIFSAAKNQFDKGPAPYFPGSTLAPVAQDTTNAQNSIRAAVPQLQQTAQDAAFASNYGLTKAIDPASNPFFQKNVEGTIRPMVQAFTDPGGVLNTIRDDFGTAGQYGGTRQALASGTAAGRLADAVGSVSANLGAEAYSEGLDAQSKALALLPQTQGAFLAPGQALDAVGGQVRQNEQDFINEQIKRYEYEQQAPWQNINQFANAVQGNYGGTARTTAETPGTSNFNAALGGAAIGYTAAANGMMGAAITGPWGAAIGAIAMLLMNNL